MTNREKYINNLTDEKLALYLAYGCYINEDNDIDVDNRLDETYETRKILSRKAENIKNWLLQEAEEDKTEISSGYEKPEIIQLTIKSHEDILARFDKLEDSKNDIRPLIETDKNIGMIVKEIIALQERVKELEKCSKCENIRDVKINGYSCGTIRCLFKNCIPLKGVKEIKKRREG